MRILALIPARGRSERVPGKNLRPLGGRPLVTWSIASAAAVPGRCDTLVSTDSPDIAECARRAGALVPWLRPAALATDMVSTVDVALHAVDWYEATHGAVDGLLLLQPTSPFRRPESLERGCALFAGHGGRAVIGLSPAMSHPMWCYRLEDGRLRLFVEGGGDVRSQDLPPAYVINGAFYLVRPAQLRTERAFLRDDMVPLVMDQPAEALDIDTEWDWRLAEAMLATGGVSVP